MNSNCKKYSYLLGIITAYITDKKLPNNTTMIQITYYAFNLIKVYTRTRYFKFITDKNGFRIEEQRRVK